MSLKGRDADKKNLPHILKYAGISYLVIAGRGNYGKFFQSILTRGPDMDDYVFSDGQHLLKIVDQGNLLNAFAGNPIKD